MDEDEDEYDFSYIESQDASLNSTSIDFNTSSDLEEDDGPIFSPEEADKTATALGKCFRVYNPGGYICRRNRDQSSSFVHCSHSIKIIEKYASLRQTMETRAHLELTRDYISRIQSARNFVSYLEAMAREEVQSLYAIQQRGDVGVPMSDDHPTTKIYEMSAICDDLRIHVGHWNSIKQHLHTNRWLKPLLPRLCVEMVKIKAILLQLRDSAIWWIDRIVRTGLEVLAHTEVTELCDRSLWHIVRGIEDFNDVLSHIKSNTPQRQSIHLHNKSRFYFEPGLMINPIHSNAASKLGSHIKPIPFSRLLHTFANIRCQYASRVILDFFTKLPAFCEILESNKLIRSINWESNGSKVDKGAMSDVDTSDYYTSSGNSAINNDNIRTSVMINDVQIPEMPSLLFVLSDFVQSEEEFIQRLLSVTCRGTSLLKAQQKSQVSKHRPPLPNGSQLRIQDLNIEGATKSHGAVKNQRELVSSSIDSNFSRNDPRRKSVTWGDACNPAIMSQLSARYMNILWQGLGGNIESLLLKHSWGIKVNTVSSNHLGHISLCPDAVLLLLVEMATQKFTTEKFPNSAIQSVLSMCRRLMQNIVHKLWDRGMCESLASLVTDKCHPIPLADERYCTKTGKVLHDSLEPVVHFWRRSLSLQRDKAGTKNKSSVMLEADIPLVVASCSLAYNWCRMKGMHYLTSLNWKQFLIVTQSDLQILSDKINVLVGLLDACQGDSKNNTVTDPLQYANLDLQSLRDDLMKQFSNTCTNTAGDFFEGTMPTGRVWRKKSNQALPKEPSAYATEVMANVMGPILKGVDQLPTTAQHSVISAATTALYESWLEIVLQEKIRFSVYGAHQLMVDFNHVKSCIENSLQDEALCSSIMALDVFKHTTAVVTLLKRQPLPGSRKIQPIEVEPSVRSPPSHHNSTMSSQTNSTPFSCSDCNSEHDQEPVFAADGTRDVPRADEWLALRVHGGTRNWLPTCFKRDQ